MSTYNNWTWPYVPGNKAGDKIRSKYANSAGVKSRYVARVRGMLSKPWLRSLKQGYKVIGFMRCTMYCCRQHMKINILFSKNDRTVFVGKRYATIEFVQCRFQMNNRRFPPISIAILRSKGKVAWLDISVDAVKSREVRQIFRHMNLTTLDLIRVEFGPFELGDLPSGCAKERRI